MSLNARLALGCVLAAVSFAGFPPAHARAATAQRGCVPIFSQSAIARLNAAIVAIVRDRNLPSAAVGIRVPGRCEYRFVTGYANLPRRSVRRFSQPFRIASVTKAFTAAAVLMAIDKGQLRKSDTLAKWYPSFPNARRITVDDLLRMRSGIAAPNDDQVLASVYDRPLQPAPTLEQMMAVSAKLRASFKPPNTQGTYTDLNYFILGGIVEKATGSSIGAIITRNIIVPLRLQETSYPSTRRFQADCADTGGTRGRGGSKTRRPSIRRLRGPPVR